MDGFESDSTANVMVLAATNIPEVLDAALTRPGRFDRKITVPLPDFLGRVQILKIHTSNITLDKNIDLEDIARKCNGMSGAELANVVNESAILAARKRKEIVEMEEMVEAIEKVQIGLVKKGARGSASHQRLIAYHESGHALLGLLMDDFDTVSKVSILSRGRSVGTTIFDLHEESMNSGLFTRDYLLNSICVALGGRAAEEIALGGQMVTSGGLDDFQYSTEIAEKMVKEMGMSEVVGPRSVLFEQQNQFFSSSGSRLGVGKNLTQKVDDEIDRILTE